MVLFRNAEPKTPATEPTSVKIGRSPIRVIVRPPATSPGVARRKAIARAVREVVQERARIGD
jgi:hypothetical protein